MHPHHPAGLFECLGYRESVKILLPILFYKEGGWGVIYL
jgi:hypothetical protein